MATVNTLRELNIASKEAMDWLSLDYESIAWLDFPDYSNVGDSAIWLGQMQWALERGKNVICTLPQRAVNSKVLNKLAARAEVLPIINGGGNFGDVWKNHYSHRNKVFELGSRASVAQAAQSVWFSNESALDETIASIASLRGFKMLVRDQESYNALRAVRDIRIAPDAVHNLGLIDAPPPRQDVFVLARTDTESASQAIPFTAQDWLGEPSVPRKVRQGLASVGAATGRVGAVSSRTYGRVAGRRLRRGIHQISRGEVVVTDRLHAMLLGLAIGRRVVAVDNKLQKLTRYADAWLDGTEDKLLFVDNLHDAFREGKIWATHRS